MAQWPPRGCSSDYLATPEPCAAASAGGPPGSAETFTKIKQPALLVWGERDSATPLWMGKMMQKMLPDCRLLVYLADDHWAYRNQLARFANAVDSFLKEAGG